MRIELTHDEALVLFEFLARFSERPSEDYVVDRAEELALAKLEAPLERTLVEIFMDDYTELVQAARDRVKGPEQPGT